MNFYNDEEKKEGAPVIPGAASPFKKTSAFGKSPMFSRAAGSIFDRLKNLSRKDMAFVGIGLSILVMAPVAEYMMNQPEPANELTTDPFKGPRGQGPLDTGFGSLSAGSSDGSGEVITPLSSRDPASLILGAQPAQPAAPPPSSYTPPQGNIRDAIKDSAREAFSAVTKSAGAPTPIPKMGSMLRGMSSFSDSGGSSTRGGLSGGKILDTAQSAPNKAAKRSMVGPVAMAGYRGVASNTPNSSSKGAFEKLRSQADKGAGYFSGGSAMNSLDKAAAEAVNVGAGGGGAGGLGDGEKTGKTGNSSVKGYDRNMNPKETLEEMAAKQRMNKALEWEFFKKYEIPKQIINAVVGKVAEWFGKQTERALNGPGGGPSVYVCAMPDPSGKCDKPVRGPTASDPETIKSWNNTKTCVCGIYPEGEFPGGGTTPPATNPPATNPPATNPPATNPPAQSPEAAPVFKDFDTTLGDILNNIQEGAKTTDAKVLLTKSKAISIGFSELRADKVVIEINNRTALTSKDVSAYKDSVKSARKDFDDAVNQYKVFKVQLQGVKTAAENGTLYVGSVNGISADASQQVKPDVEKALATLTGYETSKIAVGDAKLKFHEAAFPVYESQVTKVLTLASAVSRDYTNNVVGQANTIKGDLEKIETEAGSAPALKPEQVSAIKEKFLALSGADSAVKEPTAVTPAGQPPVAPRDVPGPVTRQEGGLIVGPVKWRGLVEPALKGGVLNDADSRAAEAKAWGEASPATKGGDAAAVKDLDNLAEASLLAASMRGIDEIRGDVKNAAADPVSALSMMNPVKEEMERVRKLLETWKIDMTKPTGTAPATVPTTTPPVTNPGGTTGTQPLNVTVNVNSSASAGLTNTNNSNTVAAAVAPKEKPKPKPQPSPSHGSGLDTNKVNMYQRGVQTQNDAIKAAKQAKATAQQRVDAARAQLDAINASCRNTCSGWPAFSQGTCESGCKVANRYGSKEEAYNMANDQLLGASRFVTQKRTECAAYINGTVEAKYRTIAGSCIE